MKYGSFRFLHNREHVFVIIQFKGLLHLLKIRPAYLWKLAYYKNCKTLELWTPKLNNFTLLSLDKIIKN